MSAPLKHRDKDEEARHEEATSSLLRMLDEEISHGITFENDDKVGHDKIPNRKGARDTALDYYDGVMPDLPSEKGRSSAVSRDVADVTDTMEPGLLRVFAGADNVVNYAPSRKGDEESAAQATDYINYVWWNDCGGYLVTKTWIRDALDVRNGIVKAYWDTTPETDTEDLRGLTMDQVVLLLQDPGVELLGVDRREEIIPAQMAGQVQPIEVFDVRIEREISNGRLVVENVPPDDFGISRGAHGIETARAVWHKSRLTRSDLVKQGYPRDVVDALPAYGSDNNGSQADREDEDDIGGTASQAGANAEIEVIEAYVRFDFDDDGIAEMRKVVIAGLQGNREPLSNEPWTEDVPFVSMTGQPVAHRWMGRSNFDNVGDLQRVKTALLRGFLDNTYSQNMPDRVVNEKALVDPDEVRTRVFGNIIRIKGDIPPSAAIQDIAAPNVAPSILQSISYIDSVIQRRTGVSNATASLDSTALDPQTATAATIEHDASYARVELIARNMAELGFKPLFAKLLRIIVRNQDRPRTIRLRDEWVDFDPRAWNAAMDVSINVGLGTGSRERDLAMLGAVYARQREVIAELGQDNPVVRPAMVVSTLHKMVEASGLRDPDQYFARVTDEDFAQWKASQPPAPTDPKVQALQAKAQIDQQALQQKAAAEQQRMQADVSMDQAKQEAELKMARERLDQEYELKVEEMNREFALRQQELESEAQLRAVAVASGQHGVSSNLPRQ